MKHHAHPPQIAFIKGKTSLEAEDIVCAHMDEYLVDLGLKNVICLREAPQEINLSPYFEEILMVPMPRKVCHLSF